MRNILGLDQAQETVRIEPLVEGGIFVQLIVISLNFPTRNVKLNEAYPSPEQSYDTVNCFAESPLLIKQTPLVQSCSTAVPLKLA